MKKKPPRTPPGKRLAYRPPRLEKLGHIADVTLKTGQNLDLNQLRKPGKGGG